MAFNPRKKRHVSHFVFLLLTITLSLASMSMHFAHIHFTILTSNLHHMHLTSSFLKKEKREHFPTSLTIYFRGKTNPLYYFQSYL